MLYLYGRENNSDSRSICTEHNVRVVLTCTVRDENVQHYCMVLNIY